MPAAADAFPPFDASCVKEPQFTAEPYPPRSGPGHPEQLTDVQKDSSDSSVTDGIEADTVQPHVAKTTTLPVRPSLAPLQPTPFVWVLRATAGDDWAAVLQDCSWQAWWYFLQGHASFILPFALPLFAARPTAWQLLLLPLVTITLIGLCMSICLHRYFSHQAFRTGRLFQFVLGVLSCLAYQQGPLWWAAKHGRHHRYCDTPLDPHSWVQRGVWFAWVGWTCSGTEYHVDAEFLPPAYKNCLELQLLDRFWSLPVAAALLLVWKLTGSYEAMVYDLLIPMMLCRLITLGFNLGFHPSQSRRNCKAIDLDMSRVALSGLSVLVGESHHKTHHSNPRASRRPGADVFWQVTVRWWKQVGLVWDCR